MKWLSNAKWNGLKLWGDPKSPPPCKNGLKMKYVCDDCGKSKEFLWPDIPEKFVVSESGDVWCKKCYSVRPLIDPHRTGAAMGYR